MTRAALIALACAACGGIEGTYDLRLVTAPGSTVLDGVARMRLTLSNPPTVVEGAAGTPLTIDVPAEGGAGDLTFEGFDGGGARVAYGRTPGLPIAAVDYAIAIYVAAPGSLAAAPVALDPPRVDVATAAFPFGVLVAGGTDAGGVTSDAVAVYDVFGHTWRPGRPLPAPRAAMTIGASATYNAYMFGGRDAAGVDTGTLWQFDTQVAPDEQDPLHLGGAFYRLDDEPSLARAGAAAALVASEGFLVTGAPPAVIDGLTRQVVRGEGLPPLAGTASAVIAADARFAVFIGDGSGTSGLVRVAADGTTDEDGVPGSARRTGHGAVPTSDGRVIALGGAVGGVPVDSAIIAAPATRVYSELAGVLATPRVGAAIAASDGRIVVAGGTDAGGAIVGDAEILDATTLARIAILPMVVPRTGAVARPLANGQVLILGGVDAAGAPIGMIELFTPDP